MTTATVLTPYLKRILETKVGSSCGTKAFESSGYFTGFVHRGPDCSNTSRLSFPTQLVVFEQIQNGPLGDILPSFSENRVTLENEQQVNDFLRLHPGKLNPQVGRETFFELPNGVIVAVAKIAGGQLSLATISVDDERSFDATYRRRFVFVNQPNHVGSVIDGEEADRLTLEDKDGEIPLERPYLRQLYTQEQIIVPGNLGHETFEAANLYDGGVFRGGLIPSRCHTAEIDVVVYEQGADGRAAEALASLGEDRRRWEKECQVVKFCEENGTVLDNSATFFEFDNGNVAAVGLDPQGRPCVNVFDIHTGADKMGRNIFEARHRLRYVVPVS